MYIYVTVKLLNGHAKHAEKVASVYNICLDKIVCNLQQELEVETTSK